MVRKAETKTLLDIFEAHPIDEVILVMRYDSWPVSYDRWPEPKGELDFVELTGEREKIEGEAAVRYVKGIHEKHMSRMPSYEIDPLGRTVAGSIMWETQWYSDVFHVAPHPEARIEAAEIDDENVDDVIEEEVTNDVKFRAMGVARGGVRI